MTKLATGPPTDATASGGRRPVGSLPSPGQGILRRWPVILVCALVLAGAGVAIGLLRDATYTATAQVNVGRLDVTAQAVPGFAQASQDLTTAYSQLVTGDPIVAPAARRLGLTADELRSRLSSQSVDKSSIFYVQATGSSAAAAEHAANVTAAAAVVVLNRNQTTSSERGQLLRQYRVVAAKLVTLQRSLADLGGRIRGRTASAADRATFSRLSVDRQQLQLEARGLAATYQDKNFGTATTSGLQIVRRAITSSSDRAKNTALLGLAGLLGGAAIGAGLALLMHRRRWRRAGRLAV